MKTDNGLFITFDGVPRSGRTTYADHIASVLSHPDNGYAVTRVGLPTEPAMRLSDAAWAREMAEACNDIAAGTIVPALERGDVVIADRWITSALIRARSAVDMKTPNIVAAWTRATRTTCPDGEYLFRDTFDADPSPLSRAASDWERIVCARAVAHFPAHPMHPRNDRRVFAASLDPDRTRRYLARAILDLLQARQSEPGEGEVAFSAVREESASDREMNFAVSRMNEWEHPMAGSRKMERKLARDPEGVEIAVMWPYWSQATRDAVLAILPDDADRMRVFRAMLGMEGATDAALDARIRSADEATG